MSFETTDPAGAQELLASDQEVRVLDVRSPGEFAGGHVEGAYNVPLLFMTSLGMRPNPDFAAAVERHFPSHTRLVVVCKAGIRSVHACEVLTGLGYDRLVNLHGGMVAATDRFGNVTEPGWQLCGFDTTQEASAGRTWEELGG